MRSMSKRWDNTRGYLEASKGRWMGIATHFSKDTYDALIVVRENMLQLGRELAHYSPRICITCVCSHKKR